jgi:prolipoprotein diacylglyceryl transferase
MVFATIIGARLGHIIFYENFKNYLLNPLKIFKVWEGGLASHGAALFIIIFLYILSLKLKKEKITFINLLDLIAVPTAFAGFCIRIGNFFNQEIIGKKTTVFFAVVFGSPSNQAAIFPRHPAQLYEAFFYLLLFFFLFFLAYRSEIFLKKGKMIGYFLIFTFSFRFFIEFYKIQESVILKNSFFLMGQYLSIPFILLGIFFLLKKEKIPLNL